MITPSRGDRPDQPCERVLDTGTLAFWLSELSRLERGVDDAERIEQIRMLEELKAAAAAAQARATVDLDTSQRAEQAAAGIRAADQGKGIAGQVGLARRESPTRGGQHLGLAKALVHEMPHTMAALSSGQLSEWRATLLVRETAWLSREDRQTVDRELCSDPDRLTGMGDKRLVAQAKAMSYRLDPHGAVRRARKAAADRRVTCRPAPDTMTHLTALLPVAEGVAAYAALSRHADRLRAAGDPRSRGQIMADTLVERVTGQATAGATPVEIQLVITDRSLLGGGTEPAILNGHGPVPAAWARDLVAASPEAQTRLRRLYAAPDTGDLVAMESRRRIFPAGLRRFIDTRDQTCRMPWCDGPVRHHDHIRGYEAGGATTFTNGQGLCERCNYTKQALGWRSRSISGQRHTVQVTTPTGHSYRSTAPPMPGTQPLSTRPLSPPLVSIRRRAPHLGTRAGRFEQAQANRTWSLMEAYLAGFNQAA